MMKRFAFVFLVIMLIFSLTPCVSYAIGQEPSTLTVVVKYEDKSLDGIEIAVCRVADAKEENGNVIYEATQAFTGAKADFTILTKEKSIALAATLDTYASANHVARSFKETDSDGKAIFTDLSAGLYLVAQLESENSEYNIAPYLVASPALREAGRWDYNVIAYPKTEPTKKDGETISVNAYKIWAGTDSSPASVQVQLYRNGSSLGQPKTLNTENFWRCAWDNLSPDETWTVDEVNVPAGYTKTVSGGTATGFIITNTKIPHKPEESTRPGKPDDPKTEDTSDMQLWITLIASSLIGLFAVGAVIRGNRRRKYEN